MQPSERNSYYTIVSGVSWSKNMDGWRFASTNFFVPVAYCVLRELAGKWRGGGHRCGPVYVELLLHIVLHKSRLERDNGHAPTNLFVPNTIFPPYIGVWTFAEHLPWWISRHSLGCTQVPGQWIASNHLIPVGHLRYTLHFPQCFSFLGWGFRLNYVL